MLLKKKIVCPQCEGTGKHVNPAIDGNGLSREDFDQDPDFEDAYFSGRYDIRCTLCDGNNVIDEVIEDLDNPEYIEWLEDQRSIQETYDIEAAERRMGA